MGLHTKNLDNIINKLIPKENLRLNQSRGYMEYEWKQWKGYKKLHAVKSTNENNIRFALCGISPFFDYIFIEPPTTQIKCRNCERKLNGI